jgi:hypothetical protein
MSGQAMVSQTGLNGGLKTGIQLASSLAAGTTGIGAMTTAIMLAGSASASAGTTGNLGVWSPLGGANLTASSLMVGYLGSVAFGPYSRERVTRVHERRVAAVEFESRKTIIRPRREDSPEPSVWNP